MCVQATQGVDDSSAVVFANFNQLFKVQLLFETSTSYLRCSSCETQAAAGVNQGDC